MAKGLREITKDKMYYEFRSDGKYNLTIENGLLTIEHKGMLNALNKGLVGAKSIKIENITGVQLKKPGLTCGYIQFILNGHEIKGGVNNAIKDENTILFLKKELDWALEIKQYIESYKPTVNNNSSTADEILKYKNLLDMGAITEEEFNDKKKQLLDV